MKSPEAVTCRGVERAYHLDATDVPALRGVDLVLERGSFTALVGPSGSGKSTLLRLLACVDRADNGEVLIDGTDVTRLSRGRRVKMRRKRIGYMFQSPADNLLEYLTVRQHLELGARLRGLRGYKGEVTAMLERLGLPDRADHLPHQLSGGQQQRQAIGFAVIAPAVVLLADEPTGELDHGTVDSVLAAFAVLAETGVAVVAATHDPAVSSRADQVIQMRDGQVVT
ncbi:ABC transporter ATP-binding protein [Virgisporangium ochraceum]